MERKYLLTSFGYAIVGLLLGIYMAASKNHSQFVTHAHIMLLGFVVSFIYAVAYKLWVGNAPSKLSNIQFYFHQIGTLSLVAGLFLMFANVVSENMLGPILGVSSVLVFVGVVLMKIQLIKATKKS